MYALGMSEVQVVREHEDAGGWSFTVRVGRGSEDRLHTLTLSWADHEHWTRGAIPPSTIAEAIVRVALGAKDELPERLDAARLTREIEGFPDRLSAQLAGS